MSNNGSFGASESHSLLVVVDFFKFNTVILLVLQLQNDLAFN